MYDLVIVGGGFAGMWAALGAAHEAIENAAEVRITVVSKDPFLTIRPRLYERNPETLRIPLAPSFEPKTPEEPGHNTFVILGAGLTGIELATEMRDRIEAFTDPETADRARIVLVEQAEVVGADMGANPRPAIEKALRRAKVELRLGTRIERVGQDAAILSSGERVSTGTVIVTAGLQASPLAQALPVELDELGRVPTDEMLRVKGLAHVYVAGDIARAYVDDEHLALMSCQHAMTMGKFAGYNAVRALIGLPQRPYRQPDYLTCLDLGRSGALLTTGWERSVEMNGTGAKQLKRQINTQWIYPPEADRNALLAAAHIDARPGQ